MNLGLSAPSAARPKTTRLVRIGQSALALHFRDQPSRNTVRMGNALVTSRPIPAPMPVEFSEPSLERLRLKLRYKVLYHVGHHCPDVDDIVQETLTRFVRAGRQSQIRNNAEEFGAFVNGVCRNVILEYRRRVRREPLADAEIFEMRQAIDLGLAELAERDQTILRSLYLEGREKEDICREWNMTDAQFRVVLFRAKERFRRAYPNGQAVLSTRGTL